MTTSKKLMELYFTRLNLILHTVLYRVKSTFKCEFPGGARRCEDGIDIINSTLKMELNRLGLVLRTAESLSVFAF